MAVRRELSGLPLVEDSRHSILRIRSGDLSHLEKHVYTRYPTREWGTFFRFGYRRTSWGLALSYVDGFWPEPGDLDRQVGLTRFLSQYSRRAFHESAQSPLAIGVVHSHPEQCYTWPSSLDDDMDTYFAQEFNSFGKGKPYCSLILQRSPVTGLTFTARVYDRGEWLPVEKLVTVGAHVDLLTSQADDKLPAEASAESSTGETTRSRLISVLGPASADRLKQATVGIIGCSGTGSPAAHVLARAGVGSFVLIDPKRFAKSNLERMHGSRWDHTLKDPPHKVELLADFMQSIDPSVRITTLAGNVLHDNVLDELLRCDILLGCTDTQHARAALSDLASHYLLPSVDLGVLMEGQNGQVTSQVVDIVTYDPDLPCAFCSGRIDGTQLSIELMSDEERRHRQNEAELAASRGADPDQYWKRQQPQLHTVGYVTTTLGALGAGYIEGILTGTFSPPHPWFQFDIGRARLAVTAPPRVQITGCKCSFHIGWGDLARSFRNVSLPNHWPRRAVLLRRPNQGSAGT